MSHNKKHKKPLISLCMIVKNEEANLPRCLESVKGVVDEMIIVDTGSIDRTKEIAQSYGAKVYDFEWVDDFAAARNYGLERASGEWILVLDADEQLELETQRNLRNSLAKTKAHGFEIIVRSFQTSDSLVAKSDALIVRMFRNNPQYRYQWRYHEQIISSIQSYGGKIAKSSFVILHYGYTNNIVQGGNNRQSRGISILNKAIGENPKSLYLKFALSFEYYNNGEYEKAEDILVEIITQNNLETIKREVPIVMLQEALVVLGDIAIKKNEYLFAIQCAETGLTINSSQRLNRFCLSTKALAQLLAANDFLNQLMNKSMVDLHEFQAHLDNLINSKQTFESLLAFEDQPELAKERLATWVNDCQRIISTLIENKPANQYSHR